MPNWCANTVKLTHTDPAMITRAAEAFKSEKFCEEFFPMPAELRETTAPAPEGTKPVVVDGVEYLSWYDFSVSEWGTKWDFGGDIVHKSNYEVTASFDSAWSPPIAIFKHLEDLGFDVELNYFESGMGFVGLYTTTYGEEYYDDMRDAPDEIREMWGIDEMLAEIDEDDEA